MKKIEVNQDDALARYLELTQIDGGSGGEIDVANRVIEMLTDAGLDESAIEFDGAETRTQIVGNCGNLIVKLPGNGSGPRTMLSAHLDTVPICLGCDPVVEGDFVYSRGDTGLGADNRAGCAAILTGAIERLKSGDVQLDPAVLLFTVQEEVGLKGAQQLDASKVGPVDRGFNFDGGAVDEAVVGAIGGERMDIKLIGIPAHAGGAPEKGASAIVMAAKAIAQLDESGWLGSIQRDGKFGTSNVGIINGGEATNVVTPEVTLRAEARSHDAEFRIRIVNEIKQAFETAAAAVCNDEGLCGQCEFKSNVDYEAFRLPDDDPSIGKLEEALSLIGREPSRKVVNGGLDANWLGNHGINAVTIGCGQMNIHTADEQLDIPEYMAACQLAATLIGQPGES